MCSIDSLDGGSGVYVEVIGRSSRVVLNDTSRIQSVFKVSLHSILEPAYKIWQIIVSTMCKFDLKGRKYILLYFLPLWSEKCSLLQINTSPTRRFQYLYTLKQSQRSTQTIHKPLFYTRALRRLCIENVIMFTLLTKTSSSIRRVVFSFLVLSLNCEAIHSLFIYYNFNVYVVAVHL